MGRRISARHVRQMEKADLNKLEVPAEYLYGKVIAEPVVDQKTGEIIAQAGQDVTQ